MLRIGTRKEVKEYFESEAASQSKIKKSDKSVFDIKKELDPNKDYLKIGSAVDCILTGEENQFEEDFFIVEDISISDSIKQILDIVYEEKIKEFNDFLEEAEEAEETNRSVFIGDLGNYPEYILAACDEVEYGKRYKNETKLSKVLEKKEYFNSKIASYGKTILTEAQKEVVDNVVTSLRTNPRTERFFNRELYKNVENIDIYYQLPIYFKVDGYGELCKALLDIVIVEYKEDGTIEATPVDLKTTSYDTFYFVKSFIKFGYDYQSVWYSFALRKFLEKKFPSDAIKINDFLFIAESTVNVGNPIVAKVDENVSRNALHGKLYKKGLVELFERYLFYKQNGLSTEVETAKSGNKPVIITEDGIKEAEKDIESPDW